MPPGFRLPTQERYQPKKLPKPGDPNFIGPVQPKSPNYGFKSQGPPPPATDPAITELNKYIQYLTPAEQTIQANRAAQRDFAVQQARKRQKQLENLINLATKGAAGVKAQQALLRQAGYSDISIDGVSGPQTTRYLNEYVTRETEKLQQGLRQKYEFSNPATLRAEGNAKFAKDAIGARDEIRAYVDAANKLLNKQLAELSGRYGSGHVPDSDKSIQEVLETRKVLADLKARSLDPKRMDNVSVMELLPRIRELAAAPELMSPEERAKFKSELGAANAIGGDSFWDPIKTVAGPVLDLLDNITNRGSEIFAAGQMADGTLSKLGAFIGSATSWLKIPGGISVADFIAPKGSEARKAMEATDEVPERQNLVYSGDLLSIGQALTNRFPEQYLRKHPGAGIYLPGQDKNSMQYGGFGPATSIPQKEDGDNVDDLKSGFADILAIPLKDPTIVIGSALKPFTKVGTHATEKFLASEFGAELAERTSIEYAEQFARRAFLDLDITGRALAADVYYVFEDAALSGSADALQKAMPGLDPITANAAIAARDAAEGAVEEVNQAAANVILDDFVAGGWNPEVSVYRQLANYTQTKLGLEANVSAGRKAVALSDRFQYLRDTARPASPAAAVFEQRAVTFVPEALSHATSMVGKTWRSAWHSIVNAQVAGLSLEERFWRLADKVHESKNAALSAAFDGTFRPYREGMGQFLVGNVPQTVPTSSYLSAATQSVVNGRTFEDALRQMEVAFATFDGSLGARAAEQFYEDLTRGFLVTAQTKARLVKDAAANQGLSIGKSVKNATRKDAEDAINKLGPEYQDYFAERLSMAARNNTWGSIVRDVLAIQADDILADEVRRVIKQTYAREKDAIRTGKRGKTTLKQKGARLALDVLEAGAPAELRFMYNSSNDAMHAKLRAQAMDRYISAFYLPKETRAALIRAAETVTTEDELFRVAKRAVRAVLEAKGINEPSKIIALMEKQKAFTKVVSRPLRHVDDFGQPSKDLHTLSQRVENVRVPAPHKIAEALHTAILNGITDATLAEKLRTRIRVSMGAPGRIQVWFHGVTLSMAYHEAHRLWKFLVVSNAGLPLIGASAGFIGTDGDITDRLRGAGLGFAIGTVGMTRYVFRIAGFEDRLRILLSDGFTADVFIPGYAKLRSVRYEEDPVRRFLSHDSVRLGDLRTSHFENDLLVHIDPTWEVLPRSAPHATEAWYRILNYQIHPESDPVMAILLRHKAGHMGGKEADRAIADFLKTEEGKLWKKRWQGARGGASPKAALERMRKFVDTYTTPELATLRISGGPGGIAAQVDHAHIKQLLKDGIGPDFFHAQKSFRFPRHIGDVWASYKQAVGKVVLSEPSNKWNRTPWATSIFNKEYDRLVRNGFDPSIAAQRADALAVDRVNNTLQRWDTNSRLSQKIDIYVPFQGDRQEVFRAFGRIVNENPARVVRVGAEVARLFNNGVNNGIFQKNEFTGEWQMTIPGSARLARTLFGYDGDIQFDTNISNMLFLTNGAYNVGFLPAPGGPAWSVFSRKLAEWQPEVFTGKWPLQKFFFNYGPNGNILRQDNSRLWMALTGDTPPWEFGNQAEWRKNHDRYTVEVAREMMYQHRLAGGDADWIPSDEEVEEATSNFYKAWAFFSATNISGAFPTLTTRDKFQQARDLWSGMGFPGADGKQVEGIFDTKKFLEQYPEFEAYMGATSEYVGPDDLNTIKQLGIEDPATENYRAEGTVGYRVPLNWTKWKEQFKTNRRYSKYFAEYANVSAIPDIIERERKMVELQKAYPDVVGKLDRKADVVKEIAHVMRNYPQHRQEMAYQRIREQYGVSAPEFYKFQREADDPYYLPNPYTHARQGFEVANEVRSHFGNDFTSAAAQKYVADLSPAEQKRYWYYMKETVGFTEEFDNPQAVVNRYKWLERKYYETSNKYSFLNRSDDTWKNPFTEAVNKMKGDIAEETSKVWQTINTVQAELDAAYKAKAWNSYNALKQKRDQLYDVLDALRDKLFEKLPDLTQYYEDLRAVEIYEDAGNMTEAKRIKQQAQMDAVNVPWVLTTEQSRYMRMPDSVKQAYVKDLVDSLEMPAGKIDYDVRKYIKEKTGMTKMFWEYLTPMQKDMMEQLYPWQVEKWKYDSNYYLHGEGSNNGHSGGGWGKWYGRRGGSDLSLAYAILKQYGGQRMEKPASFQEYLNLPKGNAQVRSDWLRKHPEVVAYLDSTPMRKVPAHLRDFVIGTLAKYGRWSPGSFETADGANSFSVAWAREQLMIWNQRPSVLGPATYDQWLQMPSGQAKKQFLESHPEVKEWIRKGPMANMPEMYQDVVRDIMVRYGGWSSDQDPLGDTIKQFYALPGHAREQFLLNHPELEAYWAVSRTPKEQAMFDLQDTYFGIQDVRAKQAFLDSHPELQRHFMEARTKRYEKFLNQVAIYMGANPEMFQQYLDRQEDILSELLHRFAEPVAIREVAFTDGAVGKGTIEGGRQRRPRQA